MSQPRPSGVTEPADSKAVPTGADISKGVSAFLSGVLEQLSITSWLPSVVLVGNAAVLMTLQGMKQLSLGAAIQALTDLQWGAIIVLILSIIISAVAIQAFEFEGIRFWEGYLRSGLLERLGPPTHRGFRRQTGSPGHRLRRQGHDCIRRRAAESARHSDNN